MFEREDKALNMTPIGREAFVFFVHADNPVDSLKVEEIQGIYSGNITNWKEVGGEDVEIRAFQRPEGSGSQTMLKR
ncbi:substrate-binding domain-containing protein [Piscibacillus salipiscarius]|uniref:substrate-binding domain-containing protein n=1 Tax=Piscibacillus salipiscarius TaxID=299480 RepID=UPI000AB7C447|nr:substrate-binding domain-containing protein [Piscibacillus salipiscarius]